MFQGPCLSFAHGFGAGYKGPLQVVARIDSHAQRAAFIRVFQFGWGASLIGVSKTGPMEAFLSVLMFAIRTGGCRRRSSDASRA